MGKIVYERESYDIIRSCMEVHKQLGYGFLEAVYQEALAIEFKNSCVPFEQQKLLDIFYKYQKLNKRYVADFICYDKIILELKATTGISQDNLCQLYNYHKATGLKLGILINFGEKSLKFKRIVL